MKVRKGDTVKVLSGASRGKTGKVLNVMSETGRLTIEGVNLRTKHSRPRKQGQTGQKIEFPASMHLSNVALVCPKCGKPTRVGVLGAGREKKRMCKKCGQPIE